MAEHEVKEQDKSDELVDMIEKLMDCLLYTSDAADEL